MNNNSKLFISSNNILASEKSNLVGAACRIAMQSKTYYSFRLIDFRTWILPAIDHKQIMIFFDYFGHPKGYITWANLAPDTELRILNDPGFLLHDSEWDEGSSTWILDCCFPNGGLLYAIPHLRNLLREQGVIRVRWGRRNPDYTIKKMVERTT